MKIYFRIIIFIIFQFCTTYLFSQDLPSQLSILNGLRKDHFELGKELDTNKLSNYSESTNRSIQKISKLIKATYDIEVIRDSADKFLGDFVLANDWLNDTLTSQLEYLIIDDLFRICMSIQRYKLFNLLNIVFFNDKSLDLLSQSYDTYIYLKTGNVYNFLNQQNTFKYLIIRDIDNFKNNSNAEVFDRLKLNIISISIANYDTLESKFFYSKLIENSISDLDTNSSFENIVFTQELSNWDLIKGFSSHSSILLSKIYKHFCPAYIFNIIYVNLNWPEQTRKELKNILFYNNYSKFVLFIQKHDFYSRDINEYKQIKLNDYISLGQFNHQSAYDDESEIEIPNLSYIDSIQDFYTFYEPNWIELHLNFILRRQSNDDFLKTDLRNRNLKEFSVRRHDLTALTNNRNKEYKIIKTFDPTRLMDCSNIYFGSYRLIDHYYNHDNEYLSSDTNYNSIYDSLYNVFTFLKNTKYLSSVAFTLEKSTLQYGMLNIKMALDEIFISSKNYESYEILAQSFDITDNMQDSIPKELKIIQDKFRYLNFISNATSSQIKKFDSLFVHQLKNYSISSKVDTLKMQNRFYFHTDLAKNILIDIYKRSSITDSLLIKYLLSQDLINQIAYRNFKDNYIYNISYDSLQAIKNYKNPYFCIDNNGLRFSSSGDPLFYKFQNNSSRFIKNEIKIDQDYKVLWYFIAENFDFNDATEKKHLKFDTKKFDLYLVYIDSSHSIIKKLISLDSLNDVINLNLSRSSQFFSSTYFNEIDQVSKKLYHILFDPIDSLVVLQNRYKLILPNNLIGIPLDYIFSKEKNYLPHFNEFSDISSTIFNNEFIKYNNQDSITIFSEMTYNNLYCNINKSYTPQLRSGILELKYAKVERQGISTSLPVKLFNGISASKYNFFKSLLNNNIKNIHLITHGAYLPLDSDITSEHTNDTTLKNSLLKLPSISLIPNFPEERQLLLFSSDSLELDTENNLLVSNEIQYLENLSHINLIYLSACETGMIDDYRSNTSGYIGYVREFLDRGVHSVIATRWKIQDNAAANFATLFYKNLKKHSEYSEAFYQTKLDFYTNKQNPFIWSSYVFVQ